MLKLRDVIVTYGNIKVINSISMQIERGSIVALIGANGAGKSTLLRAISGLVPYNGDITFNNQSLANIEPHRIVALGIAHVPEGRGIFGNLTVKENLQLAAWQRRDHHAIAQDLEMIITIFPRLKERLKQSGGTLSGGEQQMLALARGLISGCELLMLDEPSMGLSPVFVNEIVRVIKQINSNGKTILLIEQNANLALSISSTAYVIESGSITMQGESKSLKDNPHVREAYLGI